MENHEKFPKFPTLESVFTDSQLSLKGITWDNVAVLGDNNIDAIISQIVATDENFIDKLDEFRENKKLDKNNKEMFSACIHEFRTTWITQRQLVIDRLTSLKRGKIKPWVPTLRSPRTYKDTHVVVYTTCTGDEISETWRSAVASKHANRIGNERFHLNLFTSLLDEDPDGEYSKNGHYWELEIGSPFVMSSDELIWWRHQYDEAFTDIFFQNILSKDYVSETKMMKIFLKDSNYIVEDLKSAIRNLIQHFKDKNNFKEKAREMEKDAISLEEEYYPSL